MWSNILSLDLETTVKDLGGKIDNSPYHPLNQLVSAHFALNQNPVTHLVFNHKEKPVPDSRQKLQDALDWAELIVAHNAKFDVEWLLEAGFVISCPVWCTYIGEYVFARGQRQKLSLKDTAERRNVTRKKSDLVDELFKSGTGFEAMPLHIVLEYAEADVIACREIFHQQLEELQQEKNASLYNVIDLMNAMLVFLVEIQRNGVKIDRKVLKRIKEEFTAEKEELIKRLEQIVEEVMGDTPINLNSGADMTKVVYSRVVIDRDRHIKVWNIGVDSKGKPLYPPRMNAAEFRTAVRSTTSILKRTVAICCNTCDGRGKIQKFKTVTRQKNGKKYKVVGEPYKNLSKCADCNGVGAFYQDTDKTAGLMLNPDNPSYASINGFKTDKNTIKLLIAQAKRKKNEVAVEFLTKISRLNAINTYLDSFIAGIENWTRADDILHTQFNQCITATGRLSSTSPNLQNMPKRGFPVREAMVSRFENGLVIEADFSGLEFVMAGELSRDPQIISDVLNGKDLHKQTASIIYQCDVSEVTKDQRQNSKAYSFAPIYGGIGAGEEPHVQAYFQEFFNIYKGLGAYHQRLANGVLKDGHVHIFSGRQFFWPDVRRTRNNRTTYYTQIVNYPVQSAATADIVPLSCIRAYRKFQELDLKSKLVLTVHDSIVVDTHPDEEEQVKDVLRWAMEGVTEEAEKLWGYTFALPLKIEISYGKNWLDQVEYD
jgi:DNA polymerase I-like protein with 3'-5' exonuclease and polymerase domains